MSLPPRRPDARTLAGDTGRGLVAVGAVVGVTLGYNSRGAVDPRSVDAAWVILLVLAGLPAVLARFVPVVAAVAALGVSIAGTLAGYPMEAALLLALGLVGYAASRSRARRVGTFATLSGCAIALVALVRADHDRPLATVGGFAIGMVPALIAEQIRAIRAEARQAREQAGRIEELRDRDVQRAVGDERLRIARDLHDITGHHLSAIALQAAGASRMTTDPLASGALREIHELASSALNQTRQALGLVRADSQSMALAPLPQLDSVDHLLVAARAAGIDVGLHHEGTIRELPDLVEVCAYRVIQESLTNVVRHAGASTVTICLRYGVDALSVEVIDDGTGGRPAAGESAVVRPGAGLTGMRERLALVGGVLEVGPVERGWSVRASMPLRPAGSAG